MNLPLLLASPGLVILLKWTGLLAMGWAVHGLLRHRHARWRVILWRSILGFGLVLPLLQCLTLPGIKIPISSLMAAAPDANGVLAPSDTVRPTQPATAGAPPVFSPVAGRPLMTADTPAPRRTPRNISWKIIFAGIWILGCLGGAARLCRLQRQLGRLRAEAGQPTTDLQRLAAQIQTRLNVQRKVEVRISEAVASPFVCGLLHPFVILPQSLVRQLSAGELSALLSHELAHLRQHDLIWCVAWRWMKTACWFHPLVWNIPAAHNLACEQEADRIASGQLPDRDSYAQVLARLALRVLALPAVETRLTVNGSSQIARRLHHLGQTGLRAWSWRASLAAFTLVGLLFLGTAGCEFTQSPPSGSTKVEFGKVLVVVQDEDGKPVAGAAILPDGFRVKGLHGADAYGWRKTLFGPPEKAVTDREGRAYVTYPVMGIPEEKELTGKLVFSVSHPEFSTVRPQEYSVDSPEPPIQLTHGIHLEISGYFGSEHQPVTELVPNLNEEIIHPEDWQKGDQGVYSFHKLSPGGHLVQLMGRLASGEIVYSEDLPFTAVKGKAYRFALELKPGIRLEGRLDDHLPRPVKNGRVLISVRPKEFPAWNNYADVDDLLKEYPNFHPWKSYRPIAEDGTFVFESIPPGGLDVIAHGEGFVSQSGGDFSQRVNSKLVKVPGFALPQPFSLVAPTTKIEVVTEPAATLELTARTKWGKPIEGVSIYLNPDVVRMGGVFGLPRKSSEEPFRTVTPLPDLKYSGVTDKNGVAVIRNIPAITRGLDVDHPRFQVPLQEPKGWRDRHLRLTFSPGATNHLELIMEPKGKDFIGKN